MEDFRTDSAMDFCRQLATTNAKQLIDHRDTIPTVAIMKCIWYEQNARELWRLHSQSAGQRADTGKRKNQAKKDRKGGWVVNVIG